MEALLKEFPTLCLHPLFESSPLKEKEKKKGGKKVKGKKKVNKENEKVIEGWERTVYEEV